MPIYDYRCTACGHRFETRQGFHDEPVAACPVCGEPAERQITAVAVHFKGSGFYKTDYASGSSRSSNGNGKSEAQSDSKTESKAETKSDSTSSKSDSSGKSDSSRSKSTETASKSNK